MSDINSTKAFRMRPPETKDAHSIYELAQPFKPFIGTNPLYTYLLVTTHFNDTSVVVEDAESHEIAGFISGYIIPGKKEKTLFFWEIGVKEGYHGNALYLRMAHYLLDRIKPLWLEATASPSNNSSVKRLISISKKIRTPIASSVLFDKSHFGPTNHEAEILYSIGPIHKQTWD